MEQYLSSRVSTMSESATIKMAQMARDLKAKGHDVISLSLGEPDFDTPTHIKEAAKKALDEGFTKYTPVPGLVELRQAIKHKLKRDNDLDFDVNQILVSNGAKQCIFNLCMALLNQGDEAILFAPYWVSYADIVTLVGGTPVVLKTDIKSDFKITIEQLNAAITEKTKFILFSSPCNPTGSVYTIEELEAIAKELEKHPGVFIISDEIYEYINFMGKHVSIGSIESMKDRTITVNGFSKGFSMTGWRLGYMAGPLPLVKACTKVQGQVTSGATAFGQRAAIDALTQDMEPSIQMKNAFEERKKLVVDLLSAIPGFKINNPKGAFYIFPDISSYFGKSFENYHINDSDGFAEYILNVAHVGIVGGAAFGAENNIRISYAASEEQLKEAMSRIKEACNKLS